MTSPNNSRPASTVLETQPVPEDHASPVADLENLLHNATYRVKEQRALLELEPLKPAPGPSPLPNFYPGCPAVP